MAIQIGTVDGLINITEEKIRCLINAIYSFSDTGILYARQQGISLGTAFQRYVEPVYTGSKRDFDINDIAIPVYTRGGKEQSPARVTFCKKMGLLSIDDRNNIFKLTSLADELFNNKINLAEYAFILLTKQGIFKDGQYVENLFSFISQWFENNPIISEALLREKISDKFKDTSIEKTRTDIIINALAMCGLLSNVANGVYALSSTKSSEIFNDFSKLTSFLSPAIKDDDENYSNYIGSLSYGIFDVLTTSNLNIYAKLFPNIANYLNNPHMPVNNKYGPLQQVFYGAPGTGKSHIINEITEGESVVRTTFHPDSDYSTFVGAYKPTTKEVILRDLSGHPVKENGVTLTEDKIIYEFVDQAFLQAYVQAWKYYAEADESSEPQKQYLIIEEINRGNCAQIFGDLFQLLDRNCSGFSDYPINADNDMKKQLAKAFAGLSIAQSGKINACYKGKDVTSKVLSGEILLLPNNLYIWTTMNTSDQSLFPIDSAFKRRWDWQYMPICKGRDENGNELNWKITADTKEYDWWSFLTKINDHINATTNSEDKKLGFFFCKPQDGCISSETFVGKVIFYLWNDVFKDFGFEGPIFKDIDGSELSFNKFYKTDDKGMAVVQKDKVELFLNNLGVDVASSLIVDDPIEKVDEDGNTADSATKDFSKYAINGTGSFSKGKVVHEAMKIFVEQHSEMTGVEIMNAWLAMGVNMPNLVETQALFEDRAARSKDARVREKAKEVRLPNGEIIFVSNQFNPERMADFISKINVQDWNISITKV